MSRPPRPRIGKRLRFAVLERDGFRCVYCGRPASSAVGLVVDHILPVVDGGTNDSQNLATACGDCNAGKGDRALKVPVRVRPVLPEHIRNERLIWIGDLLQYSEAGRPPWPDHALLKRAAATFQEAEWVAIVEELETSWQASRARLVSLFTALLERELARVHAPGSGV